MTKRAQATILIATVLTVAVLAVAAPRFASWSGHSSPPAAQPSALTATLPSDPAVTVGTFDNGLRYYLRANQQPLNRAELRLVVNAGSILEDDDQRGLAHFVEHMAFNGTRHFPKQELAAFMQSIGMRFGPSVNATTTADETTYALQIPTDQPDVVDRALLILEDWARNVSFDPAEIDKERGVVIEEWRMRRGAMARMQDVQFPVLLKGSRYAERLPMGRMETIRTFAPSRLKQFYTDWYRPDLMALVAVGDFDTKTLERLVRKHFASIPAPRSPRPRPVYDVPPQPGTLYAVATDKEAASAGIAVYAKRPPRSQSAVADYRRMIVERLSAGMLSARLGEVAQRPGAPFLLAAVSQGRVVRQLEAAILSASAREEAIDRALFGLFVETARVARFGFTPEEFERQKTTLLRGFERAVAEQAHRASATLAAEYIRHFTLDEPFPGLAQEFELTRRFLPEIAIAEVTEAAKGWLPEANRVVIVSAPDKPGVVVPDVTRLAAVIASAAGATLTPYVAPASARPLLETLPEPGTIAGTSARSAFGITEWELSNGATVVLKPTTFKDDEVVFAAFSPGGTSLASDADFIPAHTAAQVVSSVGVGRFASGDLMRALTGKVAAVRPQIGPHDERLTGGSSRQDLETLFQLIYLYFTQPRRDPAIFSAMTSKTKAALASQAATPDFAFGMTLAATVSQGHPRARPITAETVDHMNLDKSLAFYKDRFADASDFTFVFVGSFDAETLKPLVERYVASLPAIHRQEIWKDVGIRPPSGVVIKRVEKGIEPKSRAAIAFFGSLPHDQARGVAIRAMADVLQSRLREALREEMSATYTVTVSAATSRIPREEYSVAINFGSDPAKIDALVSRVFVEIARLKAEGPTAREVADVKAALVRDFESSSRQNGFLLGQIVHRYQMGEAPEHMLQFPDLYRKLTAAAIRDAARMYLDVNNYVNVMLVPQKGSTP